MENDKHDGWDYKDVLDTIISAQSHPNHVIAIAAAIKNNGINKIALEEVKKKLGDFKISFYKDDILDLMITYLNVIIDDHHISEKEYKEFGLLKILFKIEEGDFYQKKYYQVTSVIDAHLAYILKDGTISMDEALSTVDLESMFGLSNDQYEEIEKHFKARSFRITESSMPSSSYPTIEERSTRQVPVSELKQSIPSKSVHSFQAKIPTPHKSNSTSKIWGVILIIVLGVLVAWLKKALKHH